MPYDHLVGGVKAEAPTPRPLAYGSAATDITGIPRKNFPRLGHPQYQSHAGSCAPHGASFIAESDVVARTGGDVELCRLDIYRGGRLLENNGAEKIDGGTFPSYLHRWLREFGTLGEVRKAYDPDLVTTWAPDPAWDDERKALSCDLQPIPVEVNAILAELAAERCVAMWHNVYGNMIDIPKDGIERAPMGAIRGKHYRAFCGYDLDLEIPGYGTGALWIHNWWHGYGLPHPYAANHPDFEEHRDSLSILPFSLVTAPSLIDGCARLAAGLPVEV